MDRFSLRTRSVLRLYPFCAGNLPIARGSTRFSSQQARSGHGQNSSVNSGTRTHWRDAKIYVSSSLDPYFNLAFEDWLFKTSGISTAVLLFYRNSPSVIIGRNQNPWKEINLQALQKRNIPFVRRRSGGGTVYHDTGNTNYSISVPRLSFDRSTNAELVARAVRTIGPPASMNERHDIVVDGFKVSGSAYKIVKDKAYHHGTMLINADLHHLSDILRNTKTSLETKGVESVRSPVRNLVDFSPNVTHQSFIAAVSKEFATFYSCDSPIVTINESHEESRVHVQNGINELKSWEWAYGETPEFTHTLAHDFSFGRVTASIRSKRGIITAADISCAPATGHELKPAAVSNPSDICATLAQGLEGARYGFLNTNRDESGIRKNIVDWLREEM